MAAVSVDQNSENHPEQHGAERREIKSNVGPARDHVRQRGEKHLSSLAEDGAYVKTATVA
jgi:hypothetical protein